MGVRKDSEGNYVTDANPHVKYETDMQARIADEREKIASGEFKVNVEGDIFIGYLITMCLAWVVIFCLILLPGIYASGMLVNHGGILAVPGGIIWFVLKTVYSILTSPMMIANEISSGFNADVIWQGIMMLVTSFLVCVFRRKVTKPILYLLGLLTLLAYISVGLVALNNDLWSTFKMFPYV